MLNVYPSAADLTLAEQADLTAGVDFWHTAPVPRVGVPSLRLTDGPSGARGHRWSVGTSACLPCGSALAATWNRDLVRRVGAVLADEARAKGAGVLLGPTVNIHRQPLNGRHFECMSEDPYLTAEMAVAYIGGVQDNGIGAVVKHFVCNDQEYERLTISVEVDEQALREIYLPPFEAAVRQARAWGVMGAYNRLRGTYCCEHSALLEQLLKGEWSFDGAVVSDWFATHSSRAVAAGLDLEMPGPPRFLGPQLVDAVAHGEISQAAVEHAAARVLRLVERSQTAVPPHTGERASEVARAAAAEAIVLLRNRRDVLPLRADGGLSLALIGPLADRMAVQGGGSAEVAPTYVTTPLEALQSRLDQVAQIVHEPGVSLPGPTPALDYRWLAPLADGQRGLRAEVFASLDLTGEPLAVETLSRGNARWAGSPAPGIPPGQFSARLLGQFVPDRSGSWEFGLASAGHARLFIDGQLVAENHDADPLFRRGRREALARLALERGSTYELVAELQLDTQQELEFAGLRVGARPVLAPDAREQAIRAAGAAEVAVVVVGYDSGWESEGSDRPHMDLPGDQDDLVRAIASVNPRTIVVVNAGAPIRMPWLDDVAAVLQLWFPGMEGGRALVDVLFGEVNPSGRLPTTFPRRLEDCPAYPGKNYPGSNGVVQYAEGVFVGYRHYDRYDLEPAFCFGHGLSYTHFAYANLRVEPVQADVRVQVDVTNVGDRPGFEVVQLYVGIPEPADDEPRKELRDFAKIQLDPGQTTTVHFRLPPRAFARWDTSTRSWHVRPGPREILIGASSRDIRQVAPFELR